MVFSNVSDVNREKTSTGETETAEDFNASNIADLTCIHSLLDSDGTQSLNTSRFEPYEYSVSLG